MGKAFEKQIKTIEDQGQKQVDTLKDLKPREIQKRNTSNWRQIWWSWWLAFNAKNNFWAFNWKNGRNI